MLLRLHPCSSFRASFLIFSVSDLIARVRLRYRGDRCRRTWSACEDIISRARTAKIAPRGVRPEGSPWHIHDHRRLLRYCHYRLFLILTKRRLIRRCELLEHFSCPALNNRSRWGASTRDCYCGSGELEWRRRVSETAGSIICGVQVNSDLLPRRP